ncbi:ATP-binding protein yjeE [Candidatus Photodesmus blepharus]|uniref:tRNA threonylcarbamoyladenosine biosynthesis protein TsaE n=1 Tax=Candidatus Photodesmus blepharonis TaxID=1179155 RepID=A0A084CNR1_9GAMM|nr:tRNA (adenosine(37)-N6)-threonylcarbamoyltransferase complex ATPase subunit type 1 TsaE [Candidatus Photodesmus blepharus]KEY91440.1 ATP-binding protein yjeE [Candidatus Photodesmus blepharus]
MNKKQFILLSERSTIRIGAILANLCFQQTSIYLHGSLGVGKTTFSRGFIRSLGYSGNVKSPTYTLVESYDINQWKVHHFDLYRIKVSEELELIGIRDYFIPNSICLVEWPEIGKGFLPESDLTVELHYGGKQRIISLLANNEYGCSLLNRLELD